MTEQQSNTQPEASIPIEEDVPPDTEICNDSFSVDSSSEQMSKKEVESLENEKLERRIRIDAVKLIAISIFIIIFLHIGDTILINLGLKSGQLLTGIFDLLKFIISTLIGYAFARSSQGTDN